MRILHVIDTLDVGGAENFVCMLVNRHAASGHEMSVASLSDYVPLSDRLQPGIPLYSLGFSGTVFTPVGLRRACENFASLLRDVRPDVVHGHLFTSHVCMALSAPSAMALVATYHGPHASDCPGLRMTWFTRRTRNMLERHLLSRRISAHVAVSEFTAASISRAMGIARGNVHMIENGIETSRNEPERLNRTPLRILQVGRFFLEKGHDTALKAFAILKAERSDIELEFVGDGPLRQSLHKLADELGVSDSVVFTGNARDVPAHFAAADIFWMPSLYEGLSLACMEAMDGGLPIVASSVPGLSELVTPAGGTLVEPGDAQALAAATRALLDDPAQRARMGRHNRLMVAQRYSIERMAEQYLTMYRTVVRTSASENAW